MKTIFRLLAVTMLSATALVVAAQESVPIDEEHFPDPVFRAWVANHYTPESIPTTESISLIGDNELHHINSIEGVKYFKKLKSITTYDLGLESVDLSKNKLIGYIYLDDITSSIKIASPMSYPYMIELNNCPITENSMDGLVDSIPEVDGTYFNSSTFSLRAKTMTAGQIQKAVAKGWKVKYTDEDGSERYRVGRMSPSDASHFPDPYFRQWVSDYYQSLTYPPSVAQALEICPLEGRDYESIASLSGLECIALDRLTVKGLPNVSVIDIRQPSELVEVVEVDISSMASLQTIDVSHCGFGSRFRMSLADIGKLESLDLSAHPNIRHVTIENCPNLKYIKFPSSLDNNDWIVDIAIVNCNSLDMEATVSQLPTVPAAKKGKAHILIDSEAVTDAITPAQIDVARQRGWDIIVPKLSAVQSVRSSRPDTEFYTLGGQRLPSKPVRKGVYVRKGSKALIQK